jgi:hypothetical protein
VQPIHIVMEGGTATLVVVNAVKKRDMFCTHQIAVESALPRSHAVPTGTA